MTFKTLDGSSERPGKVWFWLVLAFGLGGILGIAMPILALRFYVNIPYADAIVVASAAAFGGLTWLMGGKNRFIVGLISSFWLAGAAYALMYLLLWGYPPNFS